MGQSVLLGSQPKNRNCYLVSQAEREKYVWKRSNQLVILYAHIQQTSKPLAGLLQSPLTKVQLRLFGCQGHFERMWIPSSWVGRLDFATALPVTSNDCLPARLVIQ